MRFYQFGLMSDVLEVVALIVIIVLGIYGGFVVYKQYSKSKKTRVNNDTALIILAERYAKGDITDEEYEHKKSILTDSVKNKKVDNIMDKSCTSTKN